MILVESQTIYEVYVWNPHAWQGELQKRFVTREDAQKWVDHVVAKGDEWREDIWIEESSLLSIAPDAS